MTTPSTPPTRSPDVGDETRGFGRYSEALLLATADRWRTEPARDADTPVYGLGLIRELSARLRSRPASVGDAAVTDEAVRRAVCAYNEWDYAEMGRFIHMLDSRTRGMRRALESFAALSLHRPEEPR